MKIKILLSLALSFCILAWMLPFSAQASCYYDGDQPVYSEDQSCKKTMLPTDIIPEDPFADYVPDSMDFLCAQMITRSISIKVAVTEPCDQGWRTLYPDGWMWQAHRAVVNADEILESKFGIQYYSVAQKIWNSSGTTSDQLVNEAKNEWGLTNGAKLMVAFTTKNDGGIMGQVSAIGAPYVIILDHGYEYNRETVQHETGHCYGITHCGTSTDCVMRAAGMGYINRLCTRCESLWEKNKNKY